MTGKRMLGQTESTCDGMLLVWRQMATALCFLAYDHHRRLGKHHLLGRLRGPGGPLRGAAVEQNFYGTLKIVHRGRRRPFWKAQALSGWAVLLLPVRVAPVLLVRAGRLLPERPAQVGPLLAMGAKEGLPTLPCTLCYINPKMTFTRKTLALYVTTAYIMKASTRLYINGYEKLHDYLNLADTVPHAVYNHGIKTQ